MSQYSLDFAKQIGVQNGNLVCYLNGCSAGRPGRMVYILESCNGLRIVIVFAAYVLHMDGIGNQLS